MDTSKEILSWTDQAISIWSNSGIKLKAGISSANISEFEKRLEYKFPLDFLELYQKIDGFEDFEWNSYMFSLWSFERILKEYEEDNDKSYIGVCDYLINSHSLGFFKTEKGVFKSYDQTRPIASTFEEAIALINANSSLLY